MDVSVKSKNGFKKVAVILIALFLFFAFIFSGVYTASHAKHDCLHEDVCPICVCLEACRKLADGEGLAPAVLYAEVFAFCLCLVLFLALGCFANSSLISLKTRLNN